MKKAILYEELPKKNVRCLACSHQCLIKEGKRGICGVRENKGGELYSLVYGCVVSEAVDPVEKKPLFHYLPGTYTYSFATVGCNLRCDNCQNWQISQYPKLKNGDIIGTKTEPEQIIDNALKTNCKSVAATYTEPTVFLEFALDVIKLAKESQLGTIWVSNGFMSPQTVNMISPYLDAINVDLKFFDNKSYQRYCGARLQPILDNLINFKKKNVWVEVTTLIIPGLSDQEETFSGIASFIYKKMGADTPWHVSRFSPEISYRLQHLFPTPVADIKKAQAIGKKIGLKYVYVGNVWEEDLDNL